MKIMIVGNQARAMSNFWTVLLRRLVAAGHEVVALTPDPLPGDDPVWERQLRELGPRLEYFPLDRKGLNPLRDLRAFLALRRIFRRERPDALFVYTIKPVIYGALAAALAGTPLKNRRFAMITGLGYAFEADSLPKRLLLLLARLLYRMAFSAVGTVFFQNEEDRSLFERLSILPPGIRVELTKGTGVDVERFSPEALVRPPEASETSKAPISPGTPKESGSPGTPGASGSPGTPGASGEAQRADPAAVLRAGPGPVFLFVGRLLEAKGVYDFIEAAKLVRARHPEARFYLLGPAESGPGAASLEEIRQAADSVTWLGATTDVRPFLDAATAVVLPSWREGTPCSLLEAMAMGKAVVAADAPGSREVLRFAPKHADRERAPGAAADPDPADPEAGRIRAAGRVRQALNGWMVPVKDPQALASALEEVILNPALAKRQGTAGRALAEGEFSADAVAVQLLRAFAE